MNRKALKWCYLAICALALIALISYFWEALKTPATTQNPGTSYWHFAALVGSIIVFLGWIVTTQTTVQNNARQHTITVILDNSNSPASESNWNKIRKYLPDDNDVLQPRGKDPRFARDHEIYKAVKDELNAYEFIAMGTLEDAFDRDMIYNAFFEDFKNLYNTSKPYLEDMQAGNEDGILGSFCDLCKEWGIIANGKATHNYSLFANACCSCGQRPVTD